MRMNTAGVALSRPTRGSLLVVLALLTWLASISPAAADVYDRYTDPVLAGLIAGGAEALPIDKLTPSLVADYSQLFPEVGGVLLVIRTTEGRRAKALVQFARQKLPQGEAPIALCERLVTYKPGEVRTIHVQGPQVRLYDGFLLSMDLGQVVPPAVGGDCRYVADHHGGWLEPVGTAQFFLVVRHPPAVKLKPQAARPGMGEGFDPTSLTGTYRLHDDGRRTALLQLAVDTDGTLTGTYTSEETGRPYEVVGKLNPTVKHAFQFTVKFPNSMQTFSGWAFTKDASGLSGSAQRQGVEFGWYAVRVEQP